MATRPIANFPGYYITDDGRVWSAPKRTRSKGKWLKPCIRNSYGHGRVDLCKDGVVKHKAIHRLVLEAFVGTCPDGMECRHLDGNPRNNRVSNLCWGTKSENTLDSVRHGTHGAMGEKNKFGKLTEFDVRMIIYMGRTGLFTYSEIASYYPVSRTMVGYILNGKNWKHIRKE